MTLGQINFAPNVSALYALLEASESKLVATQQALKEALEREAALKEELQQLKQKQ